MERTFRHHDLWEDSRSGLYDLPSTSDDPYHVLMSAKLLSTPHEFFNVAMTMIDTWPIAASVNLSNKSRNRQAWVGQASCCYDCGAKEHQVKEAWHTLTHEQQEEANAVADEVIDIWEAYRA